MKILALDIATTTGFAYRDLGKVRSGIAVFKLGRGESPGMRFLHFAKWLRFACAKVRPTIIAFERPSFFRSQAAGEVVHGFLAAMFLVAADLGVETLPVQTAKLKLHATGKGNAGKPQMIVAACRRWKKVITDDNQADALCVLAWAEDTMGQTLVVRVRRIG